MPFDLGLFGERLAAARKEKALSQYALAKQMGVSQGWISELERGQQQHIQADTVFRFCEALRLSADYMLGLGETLPGHLVYDVLPTRGEAP